MKPARNPFLSPPSAAGRRRTPPARRRGAVLLSLGALLALGGPALSAQTAPVRPPGELKKMSLEELLDIEVTSVSKRPEKLSGAPSAIQVITADDIRRAGAASLPEALRLAANLEVAQIDSRQWAIAARGFNNTTTNKLLVLIDGRTVYTPLYAGVFWDAQDTLLEDLAQIEVISGPGATQWGANAVNGVINITTKSAKDTIGTLLLGGGGTEAQGFGGLRYGAEIRPDLHYRVYAKTARAGDSALPAGADAGDAWHRTQAGFRLDWEPAAGDQFTLQGDLYGGAIAQPALADVKIGGGNLLGRWSRGLPGGSNLKLQLYFDRTHRVVPGSFSEDLDFYDLDFQHHVAVGARHDVVWGFGYRLMDDDVSNGPTLAFLPPQVRREWFNVFVEDRLRFLEDRAQLTAGAKLEHNEYTGFEIQPSVRLDWSVADNRTLWAAVSRAVRTPSRIDRELVSPAAPPYLLSSSPNFASEVLLAYELGLRMQSSPRLTLSLATFFHDYDDLRSLEPVAPPAPFPVVIANGLEGRSYGAEFTADWRATAAWRWQLGYNELRVDSRPKPGSLDRTSTRSQNLDPHRQLLLRSSVGFAGSWEFDATLRAVAPIEFQAVPGYAELDLRLGWRPVPEWEFSLVGQNLLHRRHAEFGPPGSRREIERGVYGKLTWRR